MSSYAHAANALWPPDLNSPAMRVYAVLDGARDPSIHEFVKGSNRPHCCLYAGELPRELVETAPYLVELERDGLFTRDLLERAWGKAWGIFACAEVDLEAMRRHLRRFLIVQDERGKQLLFRFYDPRVMRVYLPTCDPTERAQIFGPVTRYVIEGEDERAIERNVARDLDRITGPDTSPAPPAAS